MSDCLIKSYDYEAGLSILTVVYFSFAGAPSPWLAAEDEKNTSLWCHGPQLLTEIRIPLTCFGFVDYSSLRPLSVVPCWYASSQGSYKATCSIRFPISKID